MTKKPRPRALIGKSEDERAALELAKTIGARSKALLTTADRLEAALNGDIDWTAVSVDLKQFQDEFRSLASLSARLEGLEQISAQRIDRQYLELETDFREACTSRGWQIDGQWPKLYVNKAVVVEFEQKTRSAFVAGSKMDGTNTAKIVAALEPAVQSLIPKGFTARSFISSLAEAYDEAKQESVQVPILEVYRTLVIRTQRPRFWKDARSDAFIGMSISQFRARLTRCLEEGVVGAGGRQLQLMPPIDPKDSIFVFLPAEGRFGYIGRIEFIAAKS